MGVFVFAWVNTCSWPGQVLGWVGGDPSYRRSPSQAAQETERGALHKRTIPL